VATNGRLPILYPKHLNLHADCPERYYHEQVEKQRPDQGYSPALAKGIAVHAILDAAAAEYRLQHSVPADLYPRAETLVPRAQYPSDEAWWADIEAVVEAVKVGLPYLDGEVQVLATEATYQYRYEKANGCPPFVLAAKVDLVLLRRAEDRRVLLDIVDWKTGASLRRDPFQEVASRIVVAACAAQRFSVAYDAIQTTTVFLGAHAMQSGVLADVECQRVWGEMKGIAAAILAGKEFPPNPSPLCQYCPFFGGVCSLAARPNLPDGLGDWLDGAAG